MPAFGISNGAMLGHAIDGFERGTDRHRERELFKRKAIEDSERLRALRTQTDQSIDLHGFEASRRGDIREGDSLGLDKLRAGIGNSEANTRYFGVLTEGQQGANELADGTRAAQVQQAIATGRQKTADARVAEGTVGALIDQQQAQAGSMGASASNDQLVAERNLQNKGQDDLTANMKAHTDSLKSITENFTAQEGVATNELETMSAFTTAYTGTIKSMSELYDVDPQKLLQEINRSAVIPVTDAVHVEKVGDELIFYSDFNGTVAKEADGDEARYNVTDKATSAKGEEEFQAMVREVKFRKEQRVNNAGNPISLDGDGRVKTQAELTAVRDDATRILEGNVEALLGKEDGDRAAEGAGKRRADLLRRVNGFASNAPKRYEGNAQAIADYAMNKVRQQDLETATGESLKNVLSDEALEKAGMSRSEALDMIEDQLQFEKKNGR